MSSDLYGGIEFGGTKTVCAVGTSSGNIEHAISIRTSTPQATLKEVIHFFEGCQEVVSIGVGCFGPIELNPDSKSFGRILNSPKDDWQGFNIVQELRSALNKPIALQTDVGCSAIGEYNFGEGKGCENLLYLTIGTGIGGCLLINGNVYSGSGPIEIGHMFIGHEQFNGSFRGACEFHGDCLEGIASGHALEKRWGTPADKLEDSRAWDLETGYLAEAVYSLMLDLNPGKIIIGGGISKHEGLIRQINEKLKAINHNYIELPELDSYIVRSIGDQNGVLGAIKLASISTL